jgi:CRISPR-associated protein Csb1
METLTLEMLRTAVAGTDAAIRSRTRLVPAGGPSDKVFPPTYMKEGRSTTKYAFEDRRIDGREVRTVLLDSVQSQANRIEEALLEAWRDKEIKMPMLHVDFSKIEGLEDLETISALQTPHRIADAILRDSLLKGTPFRASKVGKAFTDARATNATAVFKYCPTALIFGVWDSTGPKGGSGAKFQRAMTSEIVGIDAKAGVKTASRMDPLAIQKRAGEVYKLAIDPTDWTLSEKDAAKEKGKPVPFKGAEKGTPAAINHSNVPPSIDDEAGGVTIAHAEQTIVLSLPALRRLRFQETTDGKRLPDGPDRQHAEHAVRTALAALALAGVVFQRERGYDLRSRSILVPEGPLSFEILSSEGGTPRRVGLDRTNAKQLLEAATAAASERGFRWDLEPVVLAPAPKLVELIRKSRELVAFAEDEDGANAGG